MSESPATESFKGRIRSIGVSSVVTIPKHFFEENKLDRRQIYQFYVIPIPLKDFGRKFQESRIKKEQSIEVGEGLQQTHVQTQV